MPLSDKILFLEVLVSILLVIILILLALIKKNARLFREIIRTKKEWEIAFDSIFDFVYIHDNEHRVLRVNRPLKERLMLPYDRIIGKDCGITEGIFF